MDLVGKNKPEDVRIALIENAADVYEEGNKGWVYESRNAIAAHGFQVDVVDLEEYRLGKQGLLHRLEDADVVWLGGGNTYYLRWILKETRADSIIAELVKRGKMYGGGSAGAIVAGPTIQFFEPADDPSSAPEIILDGLNLTQIVVVPHWANDKYGHVMGPIEQRLKDAGYATLHITDEEALVIDGSNQKVIHR